MNPEKLLDECVNQRVIERLDELKDHFGSAQPFRHVRIDNFFTTELAQELSGNFPPFDERLAINENGEVGNKAVHEKVMHLGPAWEKLDSLVQGDKFRELVSDITGIPDLKYDPEYFGGGTHENRHGQGLDAHIDFNLHPLTRQHRRLNLIVYLNEEWQDDWGGSIQLHKDPYLPPDQDQVVSISPQFNRCVIFETNEHSWHGFPRIDLPEDKRSLSRRSFALYYYTDTRPEEETGPEHSTIYVDGHLPVEYRAGMVLEEQHMQGLRALLESRDLHTKRLYENIKQLTAEANKLRTLHVYHEEQQAELEFLRGEFHTLRDELQAARTLAELREQEIESKSHEIRRFSNGISAERDRLTEIKNSTSWRITAPIRWLKGILSKKP